MAAVNANSSSRPRAGLRWVDRGCRSTAHARRSDTLSAALILSTQARRRAGLRSFPGRPPSGSACPRSGPTPLAGAAYSPVPNTSDASPGRSSDRPPAEVSRLRHRDRLHRLGDRLALTRQDINLTQLGDDLLRLVALDAHRSISKKWSSDQHTGWITSRGADHQEFSPMGTPLRGFYRAGRCPYCP